MSTKGITKADTQANAKAHYAEIFDAPHWEPSISRTGRPSHPRMPMDKRAAIFASFDALVGYREAVTETARVTDGRIDLSEGELAGLNRSLWILIEKMRAGTDNGETSMQIIKSAEGASPAVSITYFVPDSDANPGSKKGGGSYVTAEGLVRKIDLYQRLLFLTDGRAVNIDDMIKIDLEIKSSEAAAGPMQERPE